MQGALHPGAGRFFSFLELFFSSSKFIWSFYLTGLLLPIPLVCASAKRVDDGFPGHPRLSGLSPRCLSGECRDLKVLVLGHSSILGRVKGNVISLFAVSISYSSSWFCWCHFFPASIQIFILLSSFLRTSLQYLHFTLSLPDLRG